MDPVLTLAYSGEMYSISEPLTKSSNSKELRGPSCDPEIGVHRDM